ncbi:MAG: hypothetical protein ACWGNV_17620, partial [Bacteroidales bacterium]
TLVPVPVERVSEIRKMNRKGEVPEDLIDQQFDKRESPLGYTNGAGEGSLTRFENRPSRKKKKKRKGPQNPR